MKQEYNIVGLKTIIQSKTYTKILEHRQQCIKWQTGFCLDCFGGGLNTFIHDLI